MDLRRHDKKYFGRQGEPEDVVVGSSAESYLTDARGRKYIDFMMGWCVGNLGWGNTEIRAAARPVAVPTTPGQRRAREREDQAVCAWGAYYLVGTGIAPVRAAFCSYVATRVARCRLRSAPPPRRAPEAPAEKFPCRHGSRRLGRGGDPSMRIGSMA